MKVLLWLLLTWSCLASFACGDDAESSDAGSVDAGSVDAQTLHPISDAGKTAADSSSDEDAATDAAITACAPEPSDDGGCRCTGPLGTSTRTFVPGGNCRFISPEGFIEGSCLDGKMHFREQFTVGGPWIEYWDEHGKLVASDFGSDLLEFCGDTASRILRGDAAAADACEGSRTDEHTVCSDSDAGP